MGFTFTGQVTYGKGIPAPGLLVEVFGYDSYSGIRLASTTTDNNGSFTASCERIYSGYDIGLVTVCDGFREVFRKMALAILGWDELDLQITVVDDLRPEDPYNDSDIRVLSSFVDSARDIVDWNKVHPSRLFGQTKDFINDWISCADPDSPFYRGPAPKLPRRPGQTAHVD